MPAIRFGYQPAPDIRADKTPRTTGIPPELNPSRFSSPRHPRAPLPRS